jgi:hypothetical protein
MSKAILRPHFEQIWNSKDASGIERFIAPDYRGFETEALISGVAGYTAHFATLTTAFPDLRLTIEVLLEGDGRAAARYVVEASSGCCSSSAASPGPSRSLPCSFEVERNSSPVTCPASSWSGARAGAPVPTAALPTARSGGLRRSAGRRSAPHPAQRRLGGCVSL